MKDGEKFAEQNSFKYFKISGKANKGVLELFESIAIDVFLNTDEDILQTRSKSIKLNYQKNNNKNHEIIFEDNKCC